MALNALLHYLANDWPLALDAADLAFLLGAAVGAITTFSAIAPFRLA